MVKIYKGKTGKEEKGLVNMGKTKIIRCKNGVDQVKTLDCFHAKGVRKELGLSGVLHATHGFIRNVTVSGGDCKVYLAIWGCKRCVDGESREVDV